MHIALLGINHKTSAIDLREKFYFQPQEKELLLSIFKSDARVIEAFVISTCNRSEIYVHSLSADMTPVWEAIARVKKIKLSDEIKSHFYIHHQHDAVEHLLSVASGLDSLIIGEKQILGQIKEAVEFSRNLGLFSKSFNILTAIAIETGKKVRRETSIDFGGSSISWAAVLMAQQILGDLSHKKVLVLGSGKMGALALKQIAAKGVSNIYVVNRTADKAEELAREVTGIAVPFWDIKSALQDTDLCICSSGAPHYLIGEDLIKEIMRQRPDRPLVCIDISVPRNIDPNVAKIGQVSLLTVDDLDKVIESSLAKRHEAKDQVKKIIDLKLKEYFDTIARNNDFNKHTISNKGEVMTNTSSIKTAMLSILFAGVFMANAHADLKQIKMYKEAFPDAKPKCIECHMVEKPKKDDGEHELNDYGKAVKAKAAEADVSVDTYKAVGKIEDFKAQQ